jgi:peptidoglycan hydrolase-like protein with peptidoglycan-binding domain
MKLAITQHRGPREATPRLHHRKVVSSGPRAAASPAGAALHPVVQTRLKIGVPNDEYEQEADRVADEVMRMHESQIAEGVRGAASVPAVQRTCPECEEESHRSPDDIQRQCSQCRTVSNRSTDEGFNAQAKDVAGRIAEVTPMVREQIEGMRGGGSPLPESERAFFEPRFGCSFKDVRLHADERAAESARVLGALAFTTGRDIGFAAGHYQPGTTSGRKLLAHEITHTIQQRGARESTIQRRIGDGHDLQSPWLAGDLRLEDIFDNDRSKFLKQGSTGTPVERVQQLLFFLGFDIGPQGADGIFGPNTAAAVRAFQTTFAPPVDGIIGPITIGALDQQANQPEPNRTTPGATSAGPPTGTPPSISVDKIDLVDSPAGAIGGYPAIVGNASLNTPGPFNDPNQVNNSLQIHFHLDNGNSANLTPLREIQRTATLAAGVVLNNPPDQVLPPGVAGPPAPGGFTGVLIANDGPAAHEIQRPTPDTIVIADAPGLSGLAAASFPVTYRAHFILTVNDAANAPIARINYDVLIERRTQAEIPNTENRVVATAKKDFVRGKNL